LVECGSGTFVRSLAADVGLALGGSAHLAALRRLSVGSFTVEESHPLDEIAADPDGVALPLGTAMRDLERVDVDDEQARAARHGIAFPVGALGERGGGPYALVTAGEDLVAVYERRGAACKPAVVIAATEHA